MANNDSEIFELTTTDSSSSPFADLLLDNVTRNDTTKIQNLIRENHRLLSQHHKQILQICFCEEGVEPATVETLVSSLGADLFFAQEVDNMRKALHIAAQNARPEILRTVVKCMKQQNSSSINDADAKGNSALHIVVKDRKRDDANREECARILVENGIDVNKKNGDNNTAIFLAAKEGYKEVVSVLLQHDNMNDDPNRTTSENLKTVLEITLEKGYYQILDLLLKNERVEISNIAICNLLKYMDRDKIWICDYEKCYQLLKNRITHAMVNDFDADNNTPLHYAIFYCKADIVLHLLDLGASLANKNKNNFSPIHNIHPDLLEQHLDKCISTSDTNLFKKDCEVNFSYRTLVIQIPEGVQKSADVEKQTQELVAETEVVSYISQSTQLRHLLKHPVLSSFLFMKWHRIRRIFYTNLIFYVIFYLFLIAYILLNFIHEAGVRLAFGFLLVVTSVILIIRELFQMAVFQRFYFQSFENCMKICLIIVTLCIFLDESNNTQFSAIAVLLATFELTMLVGQHPKICTNVVMLRTVSYNFFNMLLWFSVLILAFAFSFYILFHPDNDKTAQNLTENEIHFFGDPGLSVFKTIVMFTGEFDTSSMNFTTFPLVSRLIFLTFVFMIAIILSNLLIGVAVSDTQMIKNDAELTSLIARAQYIQHIESITLGNNILAKSIFRCIKVLRRLAERVYLFPHFLKKYSLKFYLNKQGEIIFEPSSGKSKQLQLDDETVKRTQEKLHHIKTTKANIISMDEKIKQIQADQAELLRKIDFILQRLEAPA